jgi:hypothetical protein
MSEPIQVGELLPGVLQEVIDRAGPSYDRWMELVARLATATTRSAWPAGLSRPTRQPARSGRCTTRTGSRTGYC